MKSITSNLVKFAIYFAIVSIVFRLGLNWAITNHSILLMWLLATIYFILNLGLGWFFGKKDYESFPLYDIGFRFHLVTYVLFVGIWEVWFLFGFQSQFESIIIAHRIALYWGIFLLLHFIAYLFSRKNSIKGLDKSEIFE
jgi:hypothetical protein